MNAYRVLGKELYVEALSIIAEAWNGKPDSLRYEIVKAITEFVQFYNGKYDRPVLIAALKSKSRFPFVTKLSPTASIRRTLNMPDRL